MDFFYFLLFFTVPNSFWELEYGQCPKTDSPTDPPPQDPRPGQDPAEPHSLNAVPQLHVAVRAEGVQIATDIHGRATGLWESNANHAGMLED